MGWQFFILSQALLVAIATIITRLLAKDKRTSDAAYAITAGWFVVLYIAGLFMLPGLGQVHLSSLTHYWWRFLFGGASFALTNIFTYRMLVYMDAGVGTIFSSLNTLFTVVGSGLLLHEDLSNLQIVGAVCLLVSVIYASLAVHPSRTKLHRRNLMIGLGYAVITAIFYAIASVNEKSLLSHVSSGDYILFGWGGQALLAIAVAWLVQPKAFRVLRRSSVATWTVVLGIMRAVSGLCFIMALIHSGNVGLVTVVSNFKLIVVVLLGIWLLRERQKVPQKLLAASGAVASLALMFWQK